jgi:SNF2 family DNA or RNA helicase
MPIRISLSDEHIVIDYSDGSIAHDFKKASILKGVLGGQKLGETIRIPAADLVGQIATIEETSKKLGIYEELAFADELDVSLNEARHDADRFEDFSEKARLIRNDIHQEGDLKNFSTVISDMKRQLKPFQLLAAYHLAYAQNGGNFSVPGAGKTSVVLAAHHYLTKSEDRSKKLEGLVVICPIAAFIAWKGEFINCFDRAPRILEVFGGSDLSKKEIQSSLLSGGGRYDMILVGYQSAATYEKDLEIYLRDNPSMLVLDEAHRIKKVGGGVWSDTVLRLAKFARSRVVLTGTPAPNGYVDLKNLFEFMWPSKNVIGYSVAQLRDITKNPVPERVVDLMRRIEPFFLRVSKADLKLPKADFHEPILVPMDSFQRAIYDSIADKYIPKLIADSGTGLDLSKARMIRLRQVASNPSLILRSLASEVAQDDEGMAAFTISEEAERYAKMGDDILESAKQYQTTIVPAKHKKTLEMVKEMVSKGEKILIWCEFVGNVTSLGEYLENNGIGVGYLYGAISKDDREKIIGEFHKPDSKYDVIIANPQAVGESISLHQACHNAIYYEMSFNAASYMQSKDRIHRLGLPEGTVTNYYYLVSANSIDETIHERVLAKERRMLELVEGREIPLFVNNADFESESADDIKAVIRDYYRKHEQ